jgi:hypothetical protein
VFALLAALVQSSNFGVPPKRAAELTHELGELLKLQGLKPVLAATPCDNHACLIASARELKAGVVISMGFAMVVKETLVDVEALQVSDEKSLTTATFKIQAGSSFPAIETTQFLVTLKGLLPAAVATEPPKKEPKKEAVLEPAFEQKNELPPVREEPTPSRAWLVPPVLLGIGALASGAISLGFLGSAAQEANVAGAAIDGHIHNGHADIPYAQAQQMLGPANDDYTRSLLFGIGFGVLAALALLLFFNLQP